MSDGSGSVVDYSVGVGQRWGWSTLGLVNVGVGRLHPLPFGFPPFGLCILAWCSIHLFMGTLPSQVHLRLCLRGGF